MPERYRDGYAGIKSFHWSYKILNLSPLQVCAKEKSQLQLVWHSWVGSRLIFLCIFMPKVKDFVSLKTAKTEGDRWEDFRRRNIGPSFALQAHNTQTVQRSCPWSQKWSNNPAGSGRDKGNTWGKIAQMPRECMSPPPFPGASAQINAHVPAGPSQLGSPSPCCWRSAPCLQCPKGGCQGSSRAAVMHGLCEGLLGTDAQHSHSVWGAPSPAWTPDSMVVYLSCGPQTSYQHWIPTAPALTFKSLSMRRQRNTQVSCTTFSPPSQHPEQRTRQISGRGWVLGEVSLPPVQHQKQQWHALESFSPGIRPAKGVSGLSQDWSAFSERNHQ